MLDCSLAPHLMTKLESEYDNVSFASVDSNHINNLIKKEDDQISKLTEKQKEEVKKEFERVIAEESYTVQLQDMDSESAPLIITQPEFMRRMKEMQATGGGGFMGMSNMPDMYNLVINTNSDLIQTILNAKTENRRTRLINQALDLARLSHNLLKGEDLTNFVKRSFDMIK